MSVKIRDLPQMVLQEADQFKILAQPIKDSIPFHSNNMKAIVVQDMINHITEGVIKQVNEYLENRVC